MTRRFAVRTSASGAELDLIVNNKVIATLPFRSSIDAADFGADFVARATEREKAMARHPAGKRLSE